MCIIYSFLSHCFVVFWYESKQPYFILCVALDLGNRFSSAHSCAQNSFVGATPKHPILAEYLRLAILNVQSSFYGENVLQNTGPCLFATAIRKYRKDFFTNNTSHPIFERHHYYWRGGDQKGEALIANKCCGFGQNWASGNNYNVLFEERRYYCEDSASIFQEVLWKSDLVVKVLHFVSKERRWMTSQEPRGFGVRRGHDTIMGYQRALDRVIDKRVHLETITAGKHTNRGTGIGSFI